MKHTKKTLLLMPLTALTLSACSLPGNDVDDWMKEADAQAARTVRPLETPTLAKPSVYIDPIITGLNVFDPKRIRAAQQSGVNAPDTNRAKEVLENYALDTLKYVGNIKQSGRTTAFVEADGHVYSVRVGNYLGQNYGRIRAITPDKLIINELVEDGYGNWVYRPAELPLYTASNPTSANK